MTPARQKLILWLAYGILSPSLIVWPAAAFVVMFIFDAPLQGPLDATTRYSVVFLVWLYPAFYLAGLILSILAYRKRRDLRRVFLPIALPFVPVVLVLLIWLTASIL